MDYHNPYSAASDPVDISLSLKKLQRLDPKTFGHEHVPHDRIDEHLGFGDSRAAVVVSLDPLVVAAYTDELDCVALLRFPQHLVAEYGLSESSRLLTVNTYTEGPGTVPDLVRGERAYPSYRDFYPVIADFVSDGTSVIEARKSAIDAEEWLRCERMGRERLAELDPDDMRWGHPYLSWVPAGEELPMRLRDEALAFLLSTLILVALGGLVVWLFG